MSTKQSDYAVPFETIEDILYVQEKLDKGKVQVICIRADWQEKVYVVSEVYIIITLLDDVDDYDFFSLQSKMEAVGFRMCHMMFDFERRKKEIFLTTYKNEPTD